MFSAVDDMLCINKMFKTIKCYKNIICEFCPSAVCVQKRDIKIPLVSNPALFLWF